MKRLLIAGCGDLGVRLSGLLDRAQWTVTALRRDPSRLPVGLPALAADLTDPGTLTRLPRLFDAVVFQPTPAARTAQAYRSIYLNGLIELLKQVATPRLLFVSSTAVYGQEDGSWVDEDSPTEPSKFNGQVLLEAEHEALGRVGTVVRFSGLYGPGRDYLLNQVRNGTARCREQPRQWTNRIHIDDAARVLAHVLNAKEGRSIWCASDPSPTPRCEVLDWLADRIGVKRPGRQLDHQGAQGKRVSCQRLLDSGFEFLYPDFRTGYQTLI